MSQLTEFKRGYFHKLFALLIVSIIYLSLAYTTFIWNPSEGEPGFGWYVLGVVAFMILNIPLGIFIASYVIYAFSASHRISYSKWMENDE
jgi:phosphoglycerol transferase MdoB-like AlkP superfamily enzyme